MRGRLYQDSRAELALARARGETTVTLVIAAREGETGTVAREIAAAGGTVRVKNDEVGYIRAEVPLDRADTVADGKGVEAAAVDFSAVSALAVLAGPRHIPSDAVDDVEPTDSGPTSQDAPSAAQWSDAPFKNPYSPLKDLGAADLRRAHSTYDGRGITIGHVERAVDLLIPELEAAYTLEGQTTPKLLDVRTTTDPDHTHGPDGRRIWTKMDLEVTAVSSRFTAADATYTAPREGRFRFGIFDGGGLCGGMLTRRNADAPPASACRFGVLWDEQSREVWVDTTAIAASPTSVRSLIFRSAVTSVRSVAMSPTRPEREQLSFTVQMDPAKRAVALNMGTGGHATSVASSAAGSRGVRGRFDGVAPGARLINFDYGSECIAGVIEGFIAAFSDPRVDLVLFEQNSLVLKGYRLNDGRHPSTIVTARLIEKYKKPYAVTANNPPGLSAATEHGNARWGFAVGSFETKESYRVNDGYLVEHDDNLHHDSGAGGPSGTGEIKPDIVVPSGYLASFMPIKNYSPAYSGQKGLYRFPPGYGIFGGTSQAAPTMAGALAILMSAAKQERVPYDAERIWRAVTGSARHLPHLKTHLQGHGAVDVGAALALLKTYAKRCAASDDRKPIFGANGIQRLVDAAARGRRIVGTGRVARRSEGAAHHHVHADGRTGGADDVYGVVAGQRRYVRVGVDTDAAPQKADSTRRHGRASVLRGSQRGRHARSRVRPGPCVSHDGNYRGGGTLRWRGAVRGLEEGGGRAAGPLHLVPPRSAAGGRGADRACDGGEPVAARSHQSWIEQSRSESSSRAAAASRHLGGHHGDRERSARARMDGARWAARAPGANDFRCGRARRTHRYACSC